MNKGLRNGKFKGAIPSARGISKGTFGGLGNTSADRLNGFDPTLFAPMWGWWKSDSGLTLSDTGSMGAGKYVNNWQSVVMHPSGVYMSFRQTTAAQCPKYNPGANGKNATLEFRSNANSWLTGDPGATTSGLIIGDAYWIIVANARNISGTGQYLLGSRSSTEHRIRSINTGVAETLNFQIAGGTTITLSRLEEVRGKQISVYNFSCHSDAHFCRTNNGRKVNVPYTNLPPNGFNLCSRFTGPSSPGSYDVYEVMAFTTSIGDDCYNRIFSYLSKKYRINI